MNYDKICTAVFTPIEYGSCGLSEEKAEELGRHWGNTFKENPINTKVAETFSQNFCVPFDWSKARIPSIDDILISFPCGDFKQGALTTIHACVIFRNSIDIDVI